MSISNSSKDENFFFQFFDPFFSFIEKIIAHAKGLDWREIRKPYDLQRALSLSISELEKLAINTLHEAPYTFDEIAGLLNVTVDELISISLKGNFDRSKIRKSFYFPCKSMFFVL